MVRRACSGLMINGLYRNCNVKPKCRRSFLLEIGIISLTVFPNSGWIIREQASVWWIILGFAWLCHRVYCPMIGRFVEESGVKMTNAAKSLMEEINFTKLRLIAIEKWSSREPGGLRAWRESWQFKNSGNQRWHSSIAPKKPYSSHNEPQPDFLSNNRFHDREEENISDSILGSSSKSISLAL